METASTRIRRALSGRNETWVAVALLLVCLVFGSVSPAFFTWANLFDLLRSGIVPGMLAVGVLLVMLSGGIDVSFTAIAVSSLYMTVQVFNWAQIEGPMALLYLMSGAIGLCLGLINAFFIVAFRLPTLIVTLGTLSLFRGFLLFVVGSDIVRDVPPAMTGFSRSTLAVATSAGGAQSALHSGVLLWIAAILLVGLLLRYTLLGRGIYALGGNPDAARRVGFPVARIQVLLYGLVGLLSGVAGMTHGVLVRQASPFDLVGSELDVIAAVVLGGALLTGGRGTLHGTLLGVALVVVLNNSLVLLGIPSVWQKVAVGLLILAGTALPALRGRLSLHRTEPARRRAAAPKSTF